MAKSGIWSKPDIGVPEPETGDDRRKEPRYIPAKRSGYLGWWEGETFKSSLARVESLSANGAALLVEHFPVGMEQVWLSLINSGSDQWFPGTAINSSPSGGVGRVVRLALSESLPYDVFKTFCLGLPQDDSVVLRSQAATYVGQSQGES